MADEQSPCPFGRSDEPFLGKRFGKWHLEISSGFLGNAAVRKNSLNFSGKSCMMFKAVTI